MKQLEWRDKLRFYLARWMIRFNKLTHDAFTIQEINDLLQPYFPYEQDITVPFGNGFLSFDEAEVALNERDNRIEVQVFSSLRVMAMGNPIYRAHLVILISAKPDYSPGSDKIRVQEVQVDDIYTVNDEYALLMDSASLIDRFMPVPITPIIKGR